MLRLLLLMIVCVCAFAPVRADQRDDLEQVVAYACGMGVKVTYAPERPNDWHTKCEYRFRVGEVGYWITYNHSLDISRTCLAHHAALNWCSPPFQQLMIVISYSNGSEEVIIEDAWSASPTVGLFRPDARDANGIERRYRAGRLATGVDDAVSPVGPEHLARWSARFTNALRLILGRASMSGS